MGCSIIDSLFGATNLTPTYNGWQDVSVKYSGDFKIPANWIVTERDHLLFITDKNLDESDVKYYLIQASYRTGTGSDSSKLESYTYSPEEIERLSYVICANSSSYGKSVFEIDGQKVEKYFIDFSYEPSDPSANIRFIAFDDLLDEDTIYKIANSFDPL